MKKSIIFFAALAALFSCAKENPVVETPAEETPAPKKRGRKRKTTNAEESLA